MIAHLKGEIAALQNNAVILDVNGVGYEVFVPLPELEQLLPNETVKLFTYFAVRETAQELYGFSTLEAKQLFELLLSVNGVGPKVALSILSLDSSEQISHAIADQNVAYIQSASGVGKKGAEKIILELKDKVTTGPSAATHTQDEAADALLALGYSQQQVQRALATVEPGIAVEERVRQALKGLGS